MNKVLKKRGLDFRVTGKDLQNLLSKKRRLLKLNLESENEKSDVREAVAGQSESSVTKENSEVKEADAGQSESASVTKFQSSNETPDVEIVQKLDSEFNKNVEKGQEGVTEAKIDENLESNENSITADFAGEPEEMNSPHNKPQVLEATVTLQRNETSMEMNLHETGRTNEALDQQDEVAGQPGIVNGEKSTASVTRPKKRRKRSRNIKAKKVIEDSDALNNETDEKETKSREPQKMKQIFECDKCKEKFPKRHLLHNHRFIYHKPNSIDCKICGKLFPTQAKLQRHSSVHEGHKCHQCDKRYMKISDLNRHIAIDHVSLVSCPDCGRTFRHKQRLRKHRKIHEADAERIPCSYEDCPRSYTLKRNLDAHIRSYHLGQRYPCTVSDCTFILSTKQKLEAHLRLHSLERVQPHFAREPRDDAATEQRKRRYAEELRLRLEALRERHREGISWWEGSSVNEDSNLESDSSVSKFLTNDQPKEEGSRDAPRKTKKVKRRIRRRSRSKHKVDLDKTTTDCGSSTEVESAVPVSAERKTETV